MTRDAKTIVLDFEGYAHYLIPYGSQVIPKEQPLGPDFFVTKTDYVHLQVLAGDMEPTIRHDSFAFGQPVKPSEIASLSEGVFAAAMLSGDGRRIAQIVSGRVRQAPNQNLTLWAEAPTRLPKKVLPLKNIAFLFRLTWSAPRELYLILPRFAG